MKALKTNPTLSKLVSLLNDGNYHDGKTIGEQLNITQKTVWKLIKKLEQYAIKIDAIKGKGYALQEPLILLDKMLIKQHLADKTITVDIFETLDSTNEYLKSFYTHDHAKICLAEQQTKGKGRFNRDWYSPFGQNIYLSCFYPFHKEISELTGLSTVVSLATIKTLNVYQLPNAMFVKWPNDIIYDDKKISGNLIELRPQAHGNCGAVIGIGININMLSCEKNSITQPSISLRKITGEYIDRNQFVSFLIDNLIAYLKQFDAEGLKHFISEWQEADYLFGQDVALNCADRAIVGKAQGINQYGHLVIHLTDGTEQAFSSGDTSVRKKTHKHPIV